MPRWTLVIPVKPSAVGKSRLARTPRVARAIALDTIAAAVGTDDVDVVVVTADSVVADAAAQLGAAVVAETAAAGLGAAIHAGLATVPLGTARAVLLGDLPALLPDELGSVLRAAATHPRAFVPDAEGTGSTLVTAAPGWALIQAFGADSARRHRKAGLIELDVPPGSTLRRDVDLAEHLDALGATLGPRTRAALSAA